MSVPVVFIRQRFPQAQPFDIQWAIRCARRFNPDGRVVLIGDQFQPQDLCEFHRIEDYSDTLNSVRRAWSELTDGCPHAWFSWATVSGWLVLADWCQQNKVDFVAHLDTDVLCFCDVDKERRHWLDYDFTASEIDADSPQAPIFCRRVVLQMFARWFAELIRGGCHGIAPESLHAMEAWRLFQNCTGWKVGNTSKIVEGSTWDHNLAASYGGFNHNGDGKVMLFNHGTPFCANGDQLIRFNCLHLWGGYKTRMEEFYKASEASR